MLFSLEALDAAHGDSLFLHWRAKAGGKTHTALIDGGPTVTWKASLKPRLQELINAGGGELRLPFVMVSHVDSDHTGGLGKFFEWLDAQPQPRPVLIDRLWMDSYGTLTTGSSASVDGAAGPNAEPALDDFVAAAHQALLALDERSPERDAAAVLTSVKQGAEIAGYARHLKILPNSGENLLLRPAGAGAFTRKDFSGLKLTVVAPARLISAS